MKSSRNRFTHRTDRHRVPPGFRCRRSAPDATRFNSIGILSRIRRFHSHVSNAPLASTPHAPRRLAAFGPRYFAASSVLSRMQAATSSIVSTARSLVPTNLMRRPRRLRTTTTCSSARVRSVVLRWKEAIYVDAVGASSLYTGMPKADLILVSHTRRSFQLHDHRQRRAVPTP